jgi:hypothetical protein
MIFPGEEAAKRMAEPHTLTFLFTDVEGGGRHRRGLMPCSRNGSRGEHSHHNTEDTPAIVGAGRCRLGATRIQIERVADKL